MTFCVMIICVGNPFYGKDALDVLSNYFTYHGIEFHIITDIPKDIKYKNTHPSWYKLLAHKILPSYDYIICWDLDLLPVRKDISIIHDFNFDKICMAYDSFIVDNPGCGYVKSFKYNGGLIGIPKEYATFLENIFFKYAPGEWPSYEQYYLAEELSNNNIVVHELPHDINTLCWHKKSAEARVRHYTGTQTAKNLIAIHKRNYFM